MAIDTTPSTVATNALNAIPFASLIGGPLDAAINAQAMAARSTYEFINEVGMYIDPETGEKKPVLVSFQYNNNGYEATLTVPFISILPIPLLAVDKVDIDFMANISASSSSVTETSEDTDLSVKAGAEAKLGYGPFSIKVKAEANYSAKQHSKAAQDSRYSVEYTMGVKVSASQADMPAGLMTVLNILQGSSSSVTADEMVAIYPASLDFDQVPSAPIQVTVKDNRGYRAAGTPVTISAPSRLVDRIEIIQGSDPVSANRALARQARGLSLHTADSRLMISNRVLKAYRYRLGQDALVARSESGAALAGRAVTSLADLDGEDITATALTDSGGNAGFRVYLQEDVVRGSQPEQGSLSVSAAVPTTNAEGAQTPEVERLTVPITIIPVGPPELEASVSRIQFTTAGEPKPVEISLAGGETFEPDTLVTATVTKASGDDITDVFGLIAVSDADAEGTPTADSAVAKINADQDNPTFTFTTKTGIDDKQGSYHIVVSSPDLVETRVAMTVDIPAPAPAASPQAAPAPPTDAPPSEG